MEILLYSVICAVCFFLAFRISYVFGRGRVLKMFREKPALTCEADIPLKGDEQQARLKVKAAMEKMGPTKLEERDGFIMAMLPRSRDSYGEVLIAEFTSQDSGTLLHIESRPAIPFVKTDGGKNQQNIDNVRARLKG